MSTTQLVPGDVVLMKSNAYQGKQKVKDWWSETEYVVVHQVADDIPAYEVKDEVGSVKTVHHNQLFLLATPKVMSCLWEWAHHLQRKMLLDPPLWNLPHWR